MRKKKAGAQSQSLVIRGTMGSTASRVLSTPRPNEWAVPKRSYKKRKPSAKKKD